MCGGWGVFLTTEGTEGPEEKAGDCWSHAEPRGETRGSEEGSLRVVAPLTPGPSPLPGARGRGGAASCLVELRVGEIWAAGGVIRGSPRCIFPPLVCGSRRVWQFRLWGSRKASAAGMGKAAGKQKAELPALAEPDRHEVLRVLRQSAEPLELAKLLKQAVMSRPAKAVEVEVLLGSLLLAGLAVEWPAKTAAGKPRFWDRDLRAAGLGAVRDLVCSAAVPLSAKDIKKLWKCSFKLTDTELLALLRELLADGTIFEIPGKSVAGGVRYWGRDVLQFASAIVLEELRQRGTLPTAKLRASVKWLDDVRYAELLDRLAAQNLIFRHPAMKAGKSAQLLWGIAPPSPEPWLKPIREQLCEVVRQLRAASVSATDLRRAAVDMLESAGISLGATTGSTAASAAAAVSVPSVDLVRLMRQLDAGADRGALVTARVLRGAAGLQKKQFDELALQLSRAGRIVLHRHDFASSLSVVERDELVTDGEGQYFVGMALRTGQVQ